MTERNFDRYTERARRVHDRALREALRRGHNYVDAEHLLLAIAGEMPSTEPTAYRPRHAKRSPSKKTQALGRVIAREVAMAFPKLNISALDAD